MTKEKKASKLKDTLKIYSQYISRFPLTRLLNILKLKMMVKSKNNKNKSVCLHLGCGPRHLKDWINIDILFYFSMPDILLDLSKGLPLPNNCVDYIYTEDLIEHIDFEKGKLLMAECHRVLKPGGVFRAVTPDLKSFALAYINNSEVDLKWYRDALGCQSFAEMFNAGLREWGHTFLYDKELLSLTLNNMGFRVVEQKYNASEEKTLVGVDCRNSEEGSHSLYFDCYKKS
jgi:predicted SAM-dependent methyltransferase